MKKFVCSGNLKSRDHVENTDVEGKAALNRSEGMGFEGVDLIRLPEDRDRRMAVVSTVQ